MAELRNPLLGLAGAQLLLLAIHLAIFGLTGNTDVDDVTGATALFDFNEEGTVPTWWSTALLIAAGAGFLRSRTGNGIAWTLAGIGMVWLGIEEGVLHLHERSQESSGIDWPLLYAPALAIGLWVLWAVASRMTPLRRRLLLGGAAAMATAIAIEMLSSPSLELNYASRNLVEENFELIGAACVLLSVWPQHVDNGGLQAPEGRHARRQLG